ncbi:isochorismatase hydrolase [Rhodanobacter fulvus Jip2]|uniref:Isochorismatase hydrolase n=1 Tax=Rhodanobacter fulvus Jip2 TaxID=1163408 RepID=I4VTE4_9GAMM|nr:isochorismatase family protein [Rhodanobacter fulvus]EIL90485.1 isochorismatase hydrolase [Rhodanobacter fulvus Jip2]
MSDTPALLVIDVQQSFLHAPYWREDDVPVFRENLLKLIDAAVARGWPVVRILHEDGDAHFSAASGLVTPMAWVPEAHDVVFRKQVHNAFTGTQLEAWLRERGIGRLIISGIRTEQCCETTTRVASDLGFAVDYVTEATLTFPMVHAGSGTRYDAQDIKQRTELVLDGRFARICTVDDVLADH